MLETKNLLTLCLLAMVFLPFSCAQTNYVVELATPRKEEHFFLRKTLPNEHEQSRSLRWHKSANGERKEGEVVFVLDSKKELRGVSEQGLNELLGFKII